MRYLQSWLGLWLLSLTIPAAAQVGCLANQGEGSFPALIEQGQLRPLLQLLDQELGVPVVSPSGSLIAYIRRIDGNYELVVRPQEGGLPRLLLENPGPASAPCWSPEGKRLALSLFDPEQGLWRVAIVDVESNRVEMLKTGMRTALDPVWTGDGKSLWLVTVEPGSKTPRLHSYSLETHTMTREGDIFEIQPSLAPGGRQWIVVGLDPQKRPTLFSLDIKMGTRQPLGTGPWSLAPVWDKDQLYFLKSRPEEGWKSSLWRWDPVTARANQILPETVDFRLRDSTDYWRAFLLEASQP